MKTNTWSDSNLNNINLNTNYINNIGNLWANKIAMTTWEVGGNIWTNIITVTPPTAYQNEIMNPAITSTVDAKVGLMYVSDYYYAAGSAAWNLVGYYDDDTDASKDYRAAKSINWMDMGGDDWTITRDSEDSTYAFCLFEDGTVISGEVYTGSGVRPVFNLDTTVTYISGTGSMSDPIRIN